MKNILIVDGNSILNRAFYGIRPLTNSKGQETAAVMGMLRIVKKQIDALRPAYGAVAFDVHAPTFRHKAYGEYKAGRRPTPPELLSQFEPVKECLTYMGLSVLELPGWEADDIQGTVAAMAGGDTHAYILTGDRDLLQLISPSVTVLLATNGDTLTVDRDAFVSKYGVEPSQFVDVKAIMGDASDHIPGVPGVGEKGAFKLIGEFGSLDGVYENIDSPSIPKGQRAKLEAGRESAYTSRFLAKIVCNAPIEKCLSELALREVDNDKLYAKFLELEFADLIRRFGLVPPVAPVLPVTESAAKFTEGDAVEILFGLGEVFAIELLEDGASFYDGERAYLFHGDVGELSPLFCQRRRVITDDGKALLWELSRRGVEADIVTLDVSLAAYVCHSRSGSAGIPALAAEFLGRTPAEGEPRAEILYQLWDELSRRAESEGVGGLLWMVELPLADVLYRMEKTGFLLDSAALRALGEELVAGAAECEEAIFRMAGGAFNLNSPKQLSEVLFEKLSLPTGRKKPNKSGFYPTDAETLSSLRFAHPIVGLILDYRHLTKLYATYVVGLLDAVGEDGRLRTDFKQSLTATGRLSSAEPNLQNIPIRTPQGQRIRRCFVTEKDFVLVDADYSQIELRLLAALSGDPVMTETFRNGGDIHRETAAAVFGVSPGEVTDEMRKKAKAVNFGIVYGISAYSLAGDLEISNAEARQYIDSYYAKYPGVKEYLDSLPEKAAALGYSETLCGRRRYIPELASTNHMTREFGKRVARNSPIQGSAADLIKYAMILVDDRLRREEPRAHLVMQVHDELVVECPKECKDRVATILREEMERVTAIPASLTPEGKEILLPVPLTVDVSVTENWLE